MKTEANTDQKSFWGKLPLPYRTAILGGLIWIIWLALLFLLRILPGHFRGDGWLSSLLGFMLFLPNFLSNSISSHLIIWAHERAMGGTVYLVPYYRAGYIIPFFFFAAVGLLIGKLLDVPERNVRRQRLTIFIAIVMVLWVCSACWLMLVAAMSMD